MILTTRTIVAIAVPLSLLLVLILMLVLAVVLLVRRSKLKKHSLLLKLALREKTAAN